MKIEKEIYLLDIINIALMKKWVSNGGYINSYIPIEQFPADMEEE